VTNHPAYPTILAIESSCDDTAAAVVRDGRIVLSNVVASQLATHAPYGGVIPELAARAHVGAASEVLQAALAQANLSLAEVDAVAATLGPGLMGSLLIGATAAKTLALLTNKPFVGVHHLQGHVASCYLGSALQPPFLCLLVSGGHTQLLGVEGYTQSRLLGSTLDDAVGEAYDKVARLLGLPYPGGPLLDALAGEGDPKAFALPQARTQGAYDFSFSGLKTACLRHVEAEEARHGALNETFQRDLAASFQATVVATLVKKVVACAKAEGYGTVALAGGVSANGALRAAFEALPAAEGLAVQLPQRGFCTDNAAMIAAAAYYTPLAVGPPALAMDVFSRG
jgi:N6-L-threonylcarbamoyladenine synthase